MKEQAVALAKQQSSRNAKLNYLREYVQAYVLRTMFLSGVFRDTAFVGGTALRFLHDLPRFSEDLDFSLQRPAGYDFTDLVQKLQTALQEAGYQLEVKANDSATVWSAWLKFSRLLWEADISPLAEQRFSVKIEIDSRPPAGAMEKTYLVNKYFPVTFLSYDITSLFAGKLHAVLTRSYTKGRDIFDVGWYLSRWKDLTPNFIMLRNALQQTGYTQLMPDENSWLQILYDKLNGLSWPNVEQDVVSFLEHEQDRLFITKETVLGLLRERM